MINCDIDINNNSEYLVYKYVKYYFDKRTKFILTDEVINDLCCHEIPCVDPRDDWVKALNNGKMKYYDDYHHITSTEYRKCGKYIGGFRWKKDESKCGNLGTQTYNLFHYTNSNACGDCGYSADNNSRHPTLSLHRDKAIKKETKYLSKPYHPDGYKRLEYKVKKAYKGGIAEWVGWSACVWIIMDWIVYYEGTEWKKYKDLIKELNND